MRITKFGHACVRLEHAGVRLVIDPGMFTGPEAVAGADALLITHEHPDHYAADLLRAGAAPIITIDAVARRIAAEAPELSPRVRVVAPGEQVDVGLPVTVVGELHAVIHPDLPRLHNSGYLVGLGTTTVYHPGDALLAPERTVDVLCAPSSAPWLKASEVIDFVRAVAAPRNLAIHDRIYTEAAHGILQKQMDDLLASDQSWQRIPDGADLDV